VPIVFYNHFFVARWVGAGRYGGEMLTMVACANGLLTAFFTLWTSTLTGTGHVREMVPGMIAQTAINFSASVFFTFKFGIVGPALGTLVGYLAVSTWYLPRLMTQLFRIRTSDLLAALLQPMALAVPYAVLVRVFATTYGAPDWFTIAWQMSAAACCYLA